MYAVIIDLFLFQIYRVENISTRHMHQYSKTRPLKAKPPTLGDKQRKVETKGPKFMLFCSNFGLFKNQSSHYADK